MSYDITRARRAIFAECRSRGIDDDTRHTLIREVGGIASGSAADLDADAARRVLDHLRGAPATTTTRSGEWDWVNGAPQAKRKILWKIRRICMELGIKSGQQISYAEGVAARIAGHERHLRMMDAGELWVLIGPLERTARYKQRGEPEPAA
jgi:hypothetical protein